MAQSYYKNRCFSRAKNRWYVLLKGYPIVKDEKKFFLSKDNRLCQEVEKIDGDTGKKEKSHVVVNMGITLSEFITWANTFSEEESFINSSNFVLNELK